MMPSDGFVIAQSLSHRWPGQAHATKPSQQAHTKTLITTAHTAIISNTS
ncbi:hypothetical protein [Moraxella oculi]|uniref:Uncharacterized protein n=1 Tax=Moraxella oculi TaxID=2940516 RepID=A0ABW8U8B4_9GAMM